MIKADENLIATRRAPYPNIKLSKLFTEPPIPKAVITVAVEFERAPPIGDEIKTRPTFTSSTIPEVVVTYY